MLLLDPPAEVEAWLARRRELGQDRFDEVWDGDYHVAPAPHSWHGDVGGSLFAVLILLIARAGLRVITPFNLGTRDDYRVPDAGVLRQRPNGTYLPTAAVVIEILSPGDETYAKFGFYFDHGVEELLVVDPAGRTVEWFGRGEAGLEARDSSAILDITAAALAARIDWPDASAD